MARIWKGSRRLCRFAAATLPTALALAVIPLAGPAEAAPVTYQLTITTETGMSDGTDDTPQARVFNSAGEPSSWTKLDKPGYDDFEAGDIDTYTISVPDGFGRPERFELWKGGSDDWCFPSLGVRLTAPDGAQARVYPPAAAAVVCLTEGSERRESFTTVQNVTIHTQYYHYYLPVSDIIW
ncbi:PLAT/LH2 domain-containing protein [Streptomyces syringium]|uniref:PLAT/LH2 domain-containing protein n=1 Tax=Streptomyces syringium TaxID=76729 RepID=UPI0036BF7913